jgi:uncharacterized membrane protein HdeD (DUF308 family)
VTVTSWMVDVMPERRGWRLWLGCAMVVLGVLALCFLPAAGILSTALLGLTVLAGGIFALIAVFRADSLAERLLMIILAVMLMITGGALVVDPVRALVTLTTLLGTYLILAGIARIIIALFNRRGGWGWRILHGVVSLLLGWLIWAQWPLSGLLAIGLFVGIELIIVGVSWIVGPRAKHGQVPDKQSAHTSRRRRSPHASRRG